LTITSGVRAVASYWPTLWKSYKLGTRLGTPGRSLVYYNCHTKHNGLPLGKSLENRIRILEADNVLIY